MTTLLTASNQWASRPKDERFSSLMDLHNAVLGYRECAREASGVPYSSLRVEANNEDIDLIGKANVPSRMTHSAFGQLCTRVGAPAGFLRELSPTLASQNVNFKLKRLQDQNETCKLLLHKNGGYLVRAFTSDDYTRVWNSDVTSRLLQMVDLYPQWKPAPAAFDGSRGLYASDHDIFVFLVDNDRRIFEKDQNGGLSRGFFCSNIETYGRSFSLMTFLYEYVCGNHRVWGAQGIHEIRIPHRGNADVRAFGKISVELRKYADSSASELEGQIEKAKTFELGKSKDKVLDAIFKLNVPLLTKKLVGSGYDKAVEHEDWYGNPRSVWGITGGITEVARDFEYADQRVEIERATGKLMQVAF